MIFEILAVFFGPPAPAEPAMKVGRGVIETVDPRLQPRSACFRLTWQARDLARDQFLEDEKLTFAEDAIRAKLIDWIPTAEALAEGNKSRNEPFRRRARALAESEASPEADRGIWKKFVSADMTYEAWVRFRMANRSETYKPGLLAETVTPELLEKQRTIFRELAIEALFQDWVIAAWAPAHGHRSEWTDAVQDAFWTEALESQPMSFRSDLGCKTVTPAHLRRLREDRAFPEEKRP